MLFNYRYVHHRIETFQVWLDHLVKQVWCQATGNFNLDLLHADLRAVVEEIYNTEENEPRGKTSDWLFKPIKEIHELFRTRLSAAQRDEVAVWYDNNNDIEALCAGDPAKSPVTYAEIRDIDKELETKLKSFCTSLFSDVIHLKAVTRRTDEIDAHYDAFVAANNGAVGGKCPYCGYGGIRGTYYSKREAYDHYLPKGIYPFNSVNFRNLAPMCSECNSSYKLQRDPISRREDGSRRKAFYSYALVAPGITINIGLRNTDVMNLQPNDIDLQINSVGRDEEVEAWIDVFGIDERYKAKLCGENDCQGWLTKIMDEYQNYEPTFPEFLAAELRFIEKRPWTDANFLKRPFLQACQQAGIFKLQQREQRI